MYYWASGFYWVPGVLLRKYTVKYFTLTSELIFSWFANVKKNIFGSAPENGYKEMFLIALLETIINVFNNFLNKSDALLFYMV